MKAGKFHIDSIKVTPNAQPIKAPEGAKECADGQKATFFISQVDAYGKVATKAYTLLHAIQEGLLSPKAYDLLGGNNTLHKPQVKSCSCGSTLEQIKDKGTVGCPRCYKTFRNELQNYIRTVQAGTVHDGKAPMKAKGVVSVRRRLRHLERSMDMAIKSEDYEQAAAARDQIRQLQVLADSSGI